MDKYEYKLKIEQIGSLMSSGDYETASSVADSINWNKVKNPNTLCDVAAIYEKLEKYDTCSELLSLAYERSPVGRKIVGKMADVAVKAGSLQDAEEYYREFVEVAPFDSYRYVLAYRIACMRDASADEKIAILEKLKGSEYTEKWAFELALLYSRAGRGEDCAEACDELILWFGEGEYVERALELKKVFRPLTPSQEKKYEKIKRKRTAAEGKRNTAAAAPGKKSVKEVPEITAEMAKFDTVNLQKELAKGMSQIADATEGETVSQTVESIRKIVHDIPYLYESVDFGESQKTGADSAEHDEGKPGSERDIYRQIFSEEVDGQISLTVPEDPETEEQISGQLNIEDVLREWEKTSQAAREAIAAAEKKRLETAKEEALLGMNELMERLKDIEAAEIAAEKEAAEAAQATGETERAEDAITQAADKDEQSADGDTQSAHTDIAAEISERVMSDTADLAKKVETAMSKLSESPLKSIGDTVDIAAQIQDEVPAQAADGVEGEGSDPGPDRVAPPQPKEPDEEAGVIVPGEMTAEMRDLFSYFLPVPGMEEQICQVLLGVYERTQESITSLSGNILISGEEGSGKTVLAASLIKAIQKTKRKKEGKIGKISAASLNKKDIGDLMPRVRGGYLIVDKAGELEQETAVRMSEAMEQNTGGLMVVLEDDKKGIERAMSLDFSFSRKFTEKISIPVFTIDELVDFAKVYANEMECEIDEMGVLALYNRISNIQKLDHATSLTEVKEIVNEAIEHAESSGIKKAIGTIFSKKYDENDCLILHESDFDVHVH